jgi:hypothetical protein
VQARAAADVADHPRRRGLAVGARHRDHRDARLERRGSTTGLHLPDAGRGLADEGVDVCRRKRVEHTGHGPTQCLGPVAVAPRVRHDDAMHVRRRADAHGQPVGSDLCRDLTHQARDGTSREALPEAGTCFTRTGVRQPDPPREAKRGVVRDLDQRRQVKRQLYRCPWEVEIRSLEHAQLDQAGRFAHAVRHPSRDSHRRRG